MKSSKTNDYIIIGILLLGIFIVGCIILYRRRENYGQVKGFRNIPKNTCQDMCYQQYLYCQRNFGNSLGTVDCHSRLQACRNLCTYTSFQKAR